MAPSRDEHLEIEIKFDLAVDAVLPDLSGLPGVASLGKPLTHHLTATYFDTPDLRLARAGITLRRRTGGIDAGWHLKHPRTDDARIEVHGPLGRSTTTPPRALIDLVRVHLRDGKIVPVAMLGTDRIATPLLDGDGAVIAELADDRVEGSVPGDVTRKTWREVEVELGVGDRDLLAAVGARLETAGAHRSASSSKLARVLGLAAPPDPATARARLDTRSEAGSVVRQHMVEQIEAIKVWDPLARTDAPDAVHKMRVATRRLRSALATFRTLLDRSVTDPIRDELKWLGGALGGPRDDEVMHARLVALLSVEPRDLVLGPVRRRIDAELRGRHRVSHRALLADLRSARYFRLLDALDAVSAAPPLRGAAAEPASDVLPRLVAKARRRVLDLADQVEAADSVDERDVRLHEVRKAAKRARYAGEAVAPVFGPKAVRYAAAMEHLQEVLGEHQDSLVTRQVLRQLGDRAHRAGENGFTFGRLHGLESGRADQDEAAYLEAVRAVAGKPPRWLR
jgi:CHAD domain-containing protein